MNAPLARKGGWGPPLVRLRYVGSVDWAAQQRRANKATPLSSAFLSAPLLAVSSASISATGSAHPEPYHRNFYDCSDPPHCLGPPQSTASLTLHSPPTLQLPTSRSRPSCARHLQCTYRPLRMASLHRARRPWTRCMKAHRQSAGPVMQTATPDPNLLSFCRRPPPPMHPLFALFHSRFFATLPRRTLEAPLPPSDPASSTYDLQLLG